MDATTWLVIGLIIFLIFLGVILIYLYWDHDTKTFLDINSNPIYFAPPIDQPVGFLYRCGPGNGPDEVGYTCDQELTCDDATNTCRVSDENRCNTFADCLTTSYCSGVCLDREANPPGLVTGKTGDPCPCDLNKHECILGIDQQERCLLKPGSSCTEGIECSSGRCTSGKCTSGEPLGSKCTADKNCDSANCSLEFCQFPGISTGNVGAICGPSEDQAKCGDGLLCSTKTGTCVLANIGLGSGCNTEVFCGDSFICAKTDTGSSGGSESITCDSSSTGCECKYMTTSIGLPSPNKCAPNGPEPGSGRCSEQFTCDGSNCIADEGQFCVSDENCNGDCGDVPRFYQIDVLYPNETDVFPDNGITGSVKIDWNLSFSDPPANVKQLYGYSNNGTDKIFALASDGFYSLSGLGTGANWTRIVESVPTRTIIDASVSPTGKILISFLETGIVESDPVTESTVYTLTIGTNELTPFNPISVPGHLPGVQFISTTVPSAITVSEIDMNKEDDVLIRQDGTVLVKPASKTTYTNESLISGTTAFKRTTYYFNPPNETIEVDGVPIKISGETWQNFSYINNPSDNRGKGYIDTSDVNDNIDVGSVILFAMDNLVYNPFNHYGREDSFTTYDYSIFSPETPLINGHAGLQGATIFMVVKNNTSGETNLYMSSSGPLFTIPGYVDDKTKVLLTSNSAYVYSAKSCG